MQTVNGCPKKTNWQGNIEGNSSRKTFSEDNLWKEPYDVMAEYPVILSTTFSSRNSLNSDVVYDYLIMDEASQVDIATGALALSCARNVVIVGDTKQLPNVVTDDIKAKAKAIFDSFNVSGRISVYKQFSAIHFGCYAKRNTNIAAGTL